MEGAQPYQLYVFDAQGRLTDLSGKCGVTWERAVEPGNLRWGWCDKPLWHDGAHGHQTAGIGRGTLHSPAQIRAAEGQHRRRLRRGDRPLFSLRRKRRTNAERQPEREVAMTRRIADAPQAYILRNEWNPYRFRVTLDLDVAVAEAIRDGHDRVHNLIQAYGTAALVGDLDSPRAPEVLALPLGTMAKLSAPQHIYADRYVRKHRIAVWGKVDEPVTDAEVQVVLDRARYRAENRDMPDPLIETMEAEERNLPPRPRNVDPVYVVIDRRRIGVFTTYEDAMGQSKDRAVITQVAANGIDRVHEGKTLRGWFWAGGRRAWGFASGYSPNDRARRGK